MKQALGCSAVVFGAPAQRELWFKGHHEGTNDRKNTKNGKGGINR